MMSYNQFLTRVIDEGIEAVKIDYADAENKREGSIAGFEACRGLDPTQLGDLFFTASKNMTDYARDHIELDRIIHDNGFTMVQDYWWYRCYQSEVEWVCNVVSAMLQNEGTEPILSHLPTARGVFKAAEILGVKEEDNA